MDSSWFRLTPGNYPIQTMINIKLGHNEVQQFPPPHAIIQFTASGNPVSSPSSCQKRCEDLCICSDSIHKIMHA